MVNNREVSPFVITGAEQFEAYLEDNNPTYRQIREQYNTLINQPINPLTYNGITGDRIGFIILLLEKILKNTERLCTENHILKNQIDTIENNIFQLKTESLDSIIQAGNNITAELRKFEEGFNTWNIKFETWNIGFTDFEEKLSETNRFLKDFADYWDNKTNLLQTNLQKIESHIIQWNEEIIRINNTLQGLEKRFFQFEQRQGEYFALRTPTLTSTSTQPKNTSSYKTLQNNNHKWKL